MKACNNPEDKIFLQSLTVDIIVSFMVITIGI